MVLGAADIIFDNYTIVVFDMGDSFGDVPGCFSVSVHHQLFVRSNAIFILR